MNINNKTVPDHYSPIVRWCKLKEHCEVNKYTPKRTIHFLHLLWQAFKPNERKQTWDNMQESERNFWFTARSDVFKKEILWDTAKNPEEARKRRWVLVDFGDKAFLGSSYTEIVEKIEVKWKENFLRYNKYLQSDLQSNKTYCDIKRAVQEDNEQRVQQLICGYDLNHKPPQEYALLMHAAMQGNVKIVELLIKNGSDINNIGKNTQTALMQAVIAGHTEIVKLLIENDARLDIKNGHDSTLLHMTSVNKNTEIAQLLLNKKVLLDAVDKKGNTPLHLAISNNNFELAKLLIENGAEIDLQNNAGTPPFLLAIDRNNVEIAKLLLEKNAKLDFFNERGNTYLHSVIYNNKFSIAKLLIQKKVLNNTRNTYGDTPITCAIACDNIELTELLIDNDAELNIQNSVGSSPLLLALYKDNDEIVELLLNRGARLDILDNNGSTHLHLLIENGRTRMAKLLIERKTGLNIQNNTGDSPLLIAIGKGNTEIAKLLIENGARVDIQNNLGNSPLLAAIDRYNAMITKLLIEKGVDVDFQNKEKISPLHLAIGKGSTEIAKLLIEKGAELDIYDNNGYTPLEYAVEKNNIPILKLLCRSGATITKKIVKFAFLNNEHRFCAHELLQYVSADLVDHDIIQTAIDAAIKDTFHAEDDSENCIYEMLMHKAPSIVLSKKVLDAAVQCQLPQRAINALLTKLPLHQRIEFELHYKQDGSEIHQLINNSSLETAAQIVTLAIQYECRNLKLYYHLFSKHKNLTLTKTQFSAISKLLVKHVESKPSLLDATMKLLNARSPHVPLDELKQDIHAELEENKKHRKIVKKK